MNYRREIDGLRAVAVLPVIFFHAGFDTFSGGFVGVDVFFVISGYLITLIILSEKEAGTFSLVSFYERRARRILPALFFVMATCIPFAWLWLVPKDMKDFSQSLAAVSVFGSNILFWLESGYFDATAELKPLLHTWSLAVEEQYYVLFPLFIVITWRLGRRWTVGLLVVLALISLAAAQWGAYNRPMATFFLLPTRGWELAIGAISAFYFIQKQTIECSAARCEILSALGILLIVYAVFAYDKTTPFPSLYALAPAIGTVLVILCATPATAVGRVLGSKALVGIGLISYSAYLWHQPVFVFARQRTIAEPSAIQMIILSACVIFLAFVSWRFIEIPFRNRIYFNRRQVFTYAISVSFSFLLLGSLGHFTKGFESYYVLNRLSDQQAQLYENIKEYTGKNLYERMFDDKNCRFWSDSINENVELRFDHCAKTHGKALIVLGDSHAMNIFNIIAKSSISNFVIGVSQGGCRPHDNYTFCHYNAFDGFLRRNKNKIESVVYHQSGSYLFTDIRGKVDSIHAFEPDAPFIFFRENVKKTVDYLNGMEESVKVIWLGPFVEARRDFRDIRILNSKMQVSSKSIIQFSRLENELKKLSFSENWRFQYISLFDVLKIDESFLMIDSCITYNDGDHFRASCAKPESWGIPKPPEM